MVRWSISMFAATERASADWHNPPEVVCILVLQATLSATVPPAADDVICIPVRLLLLVTTPFTDAVAPVS